MVVQFRGSNVLFSDVTGPNSRVSFSPACCCQVNSCIGEWYSTWGTVGLWNGCYNSIMTDSVTIDTIGMGITNVGATPCNPLDCQHIDGIFILGRESTIPGFPYVNSYCTYHLYMWDSCSEPGGDVYGRQYHWEVQILKVSGIPGVPKIQILVILRLARSTVNQASGPFVEGANSFRWDWNAAFDNGGAEIDCPTFINNLSIPFVTYSPGSWQETWPCWIETGSPSPPDIIISAT